VLHVPGANASLSAVMTRGLFTAPVLTDSTLLAVKEHLTSWSADTGKAFSLPGEVLAMLGLARLGTTAKLPQQGGLVLDTALVGVSCVRCAGQGHTEHTIGDGREHAGCLPPPQAVASTLRD
jgi:hypothetical protein